MPRWAKLVGGWLLAAVIAVTFAWGAVAQVRNQVTQPGVEIPATVVAASEPEGGSTETTSISDPTVIKADPEQDQAAQGSVPLEGDNTASSSVASTLDGSAPSTVTTTTNAPTPTTLPAPTTSTTVTPGETETSSRQLVGGVVTISHSPGIVTFLSAIPQPGYSTETRETGPDRVRIRFESETHTSDFRAEWQGGELKITISETDED